MSRTHRDDPIGLLVRFGEHLAGPLRAGTERVLRGETTPDADERVYIREVVGAMRGSQLLDERQREQIDTIIAAAATDSGVLANALVEPAPAAETSRPKEAPPPPPPPADPATTTEAPSRRRRAATRALAVIAIAGIAGLGWAAWTNYERADTWRAHAAAAAADVEALDKENGVLESDLEELRDALKRSEADVRELEARVSRAADQKARAEDERENITAMAERIAEVAVAYDAVAEQFRACMTEQAALTSMVFDFDLYFDTGQTYLISNQIDRTQGACNEAETQLAGLRAYVDALASQ